MKVTFISEDTLQDLKLNYDEYKNHYYTRDSSWFDSYFNQSERIIESNIEFMMPELNFHDDYTISDRENAKAIYSSLQHLTVTQATQERLWTGLAHLQFRDFTYYRLKNELDKEKNQRINTALFFKNGTKRSLFVHILARLWWVGYMTYDVENRENPFLLTDFFCEKDFSARSVVFFSSNFTSNRNISLGILRAIHKLSLEGHTVTRDYFVQSTKYLNAIGGAMILDMLSSKEVEEMITSHLIKTLQLEVVLK